MQHSPDHQLLNCDALHSIDTLPPVALRHALEFDGQRLTFEYTQNALGAIGNSAAPGPSLGAGSGSGSGPPLDWVCGRCNAVNFARWGCVSQGLQQNTVPKPGKQSMEQFVVCLVALQQSLKREVTLVYHMCHRLKKMHSKFQGTNRPGVLNSLPKA